MAPRDGSILVDGTVGGGGHARALAEKVGPSGLVLGFDRDPSMLALAASRTAGLPVRLFHAPYSAIPETLAAEGIGPIDGLLLDLGLSSDQLAWSERGFSFAADGPLDMRFDTTEGETAAEAVNRRPERELADIFYQLGEERFSRRIARRIVEERRTAPILTTARLASIVRRCIPGKRTAIDPATRVFQALRILVNDEFGHLDSLLADVPDVLKPGGRAAIISFHSLEDRRVKTTFRDDPRLQPLTKKPVVASEDEIAANPRSRSAKLRVAQRCPDPIGPPTPPNLPRRR